jgi:hypothetical protein
VRKKNSGWVVESPIEKFSKWVSWVIYCIAFAWPLLRTDLYYVLVLFFLFFKFFAF